MDGSIDLSRSDRKVLLALYRNGKNASLSRRAHVVLLAAENYSWRTIVRITFSSNNFVSRTLNTFRKDGIEGLSGTVKKKSPTPKWVGKARRWLDTTTPQDYGYFRSRWTCELIANMLAWDHKNPVRVSTETVRRWMKRDGYAWNRPRPILGLRDDDYDAKVRKIRGLLRK